MGQCRTLYLIVMCMILLWASSCSRVAITGRRQLDLVPCSTAQSMSEQSYRDFLAQARLSANATQTQMVRTVGNRVRSAVEKYCAENKGCEIIEGSQWEFNLVEDKAVNAWAMPGGKVVVLTGILPVAQTDVGLATVISHEIAHVIARHGCERMSQALVVEMGGMVLSEALAKRPAQTKELFMQAYGIGAQYGLLLPYSRTHESEADHIGLIFMAMAGYDPHGAISLWQRMAASRQDSPTPEFLSTHPSEATRIKDIERWMPDAMQYYRP